MRQSYFIYSSFYNHNSDYLDNNNNDNNPSCPTEQLISGKCKYSEVRSPLSCTGPFLFRDTDFSKCIYTGNGGAICYVTSGGTLSITSCTFNSCSCSSSGGDGNGGGAIYASSLSKIEITSSIFLSCNCTGSCDGAAVELYHISYQPLVTRCDFLYCSADDDGGGLSIWYSSASNLFSCNNCRFVVCTVPNIYKSEISAGGGLSVWANSVIFQYSNLLFSSNEGWKGGSYASDKYTEAPNYLFSFCFFNHNTGTYGNDMYITSLPLDSPLLHCFSASLPEGIRYWNGEIWMRAYVDWFFLYTS